MNQEHGLYNFFPTTCSHLGQVCTTSKHDSFKQGIQNIKGTVKHKINEQIIDP